MSRHMMPWAEEEHFDFYRLYGDRGCTCFISPPCSHCMHPGNPHNLEEADDAWGEEYEVLAAYALINIQEFINTTADRHLAEMRQAWKGTTV